MTEDTDDTEIEINQTEEQANSPGIDDWVQAKRTGGGNPEEDSSSSSLFLTID